MKIASTGQDEEWGKNLLCVYLLEAESEKLHK